MRDLRTASDPTYARLPSVYLHLCRAVFVHTHHTRSPTCSHALVTHACAHLLTRARVLLPRPHKPTGETVNVTPLDGDTFRNGNRVTEPTKLQTGDRLIFGENHVFRFVNPVRI
jgi:hypothetical protein